MINEIIVALLIIYIRLPNMTFHRLNIRFGLEADLYRFITQKIYITSAFPKYLLLILC